MTRKVFFIGWWVLLGSAGVVALLRFFQPATFSRAVFPAMLGLSFISLILAISNKRYE